jgi:hypothetical protein
MDLAALVTRLGTVSQLAQVIQAQTGGFQTPVDSGAELVTRLASVASTFPVTMREQGTVPSIVYTLVSSQVGQIDGYRVTQTDRYVLSLRTVTYDLLLSKFASLKTALDGSTYAIEINDLLFDFDDVQKLYRANIDIEFTYLSATLQTLPAAFVYSLDRSAGESFVDNLVDQRLENSYGIVVVSTTAIDPILDGIMAKLLGWQVADDHEEFVYSSGSNLEGVAGMLVWREIYRDAEYIKQV